MKKQSRMKISVCPICNVMYSPLLPSDQAHHDRIHQRVVNGVPVIVPMICTLPGAQPTDQLAIVAHNHATPAEKVVAEDVAGVAKQALDRHAGFTWYRYLAYEPVNLALDYHIILYLRANQAIGLLAFCRRPLAYAMTWDSDSSFVIDNPYWCIQMVWTAHNWQKTGIAQTLVRSAASYLEMPDAGAFAWSAPFTASGAALVKKFCPVRFLIA